MARISAQEAGGQNVLALLDTIAWSELGSALLADPASNDGYSVIVGSTPSHPDYFTSFVDHPRKLVHLSPTLASTAAGRYQLLARYYDAYRKMLGLSNFGPQNQDRIAIQQIRERKALVMIQQGLFQDAIAACSNIWASLPGPGNTYNQHQNSLASLELAYANAGGTAK